MQMLHPTDDDLTAYVNGRLRERLAKTVEDHLQSCQHCLERISIAERNNNRDALVQSVREALLPTIDDPTPTPESSPVKFREHERFRFLSSIGSDSRGPTYLAEDRVTTGRVLVHFVSDVQGAILRLREFSQILDSKPHDNILPIIHFESFGEEILLVTKFVPSISLREMVCGLGRLDIRATIEYLHQTTNALTHAHALGLTHGDLTPDDLVLCENRIVVRGWDRLRISGEVLHRPAIDVAGLGRTALGLLVGQTTLTQKSELPFAAIWPDLSTKVVQVIRTMTEAGYATPKMAMNALKKATVRPNWYSRWIPFRRQSKD